VTKCPNEGVFEDAHARTPEQESVELAPADGEAHDALVASLDRSPPHDARAKCRDLLQSESSGTVFGGCQVQQRKDIRREPPGAHFIPREAGTIGDHDIPPRETQKPCSGGTSGTTANDQRVTTNHSRHVCSLFSLLGSAFVFTFRFSRTLKRALYGW
jgi:hypothetical protein